MVPWLWYIPYHEFKRFLTRYNWMSGYTEWYKGRFSQHINNNFCFKIADSVSTGPNIIWILHLIIVCTLMMRPIGREHLLSQHLESHTMECWIIWWLQEPQWHITCQNEMCHCTLTIKNCISHIKIELNLAWIRRHNHSTWPWGGNP